MRKIAGSLLGWFALSIGALCLMGKLYQHHRWFTHWFGDDIGMATNTGIGFIAVGLALVILSWDGGGPGTPRP